MQEGVNGKMMNWWESCYCNSFSQRNWVATKSNQIHDSLW